jgi:hypothetical protein
VLLEEVGRSRATAELAAVRGACRSLLGADAGTVVVLSPHASAPCVYARPEGDLGGFGLPGVGASAPGDDALRDALAAAWGVEVVEAGADHGAVVALSLLGTRVPVVAAGLPEASGPLGVPVTEALEAARAFAPALVLAADGRDVVLIVSAHTSAGLSPRAPLTRLEDGVALHAAVIEALSGDVGGLGRIPANLWETGGSCGAGSLVALGVLAEGRRGRLLAKAAPFGVGYVVAAVP